MSVLSHARYEIGFTRNVVLTPEQHADFVAFLKALTGQPIPFQFPKLLKNWLNPLESTGLIQSVRCVGFLSA